MTKATLVQLKNIKTRKIVEQKVCYGDKEIDEAEERFKAELADYPDKDDHQVFKLERV